MNLEDAQEWMYLIVENNPEGECCAAFIRWYFETKEWLNEIEKNNPDAGA